jgi:lipopolysaccharide export system protein LptC
MSDRLGSFLAILLMMLVLASSYWYSQSINRVDWAGNGRIGRVDSFAERLAVTTFDERGSGRYRLYADRMTHYSDSDDLFLGLPRMVSMNASQPALQVSASLAVARNNLQIIDLDHDVEVRRGAEHKHPTMHFQTDHLRFVPDDDHLWTDAPVHVSYGASELDATGLDYNNITRRAELQQSVTGHLVSPHKS